jgi:alpha-1,2-mannosyltransferase
MLFDTQNDFKYIPPMARKRPSPKPSPRVKDDKWVLAVRCVIVLLMLVWLIQAFHKAYRAEGYDLTPRFEAAQALLHGTDPYKLSTPFPLTYPLFICVLLMPLALLPYGLANFLWFVVSAASLYFLCDTVLKALRPGSDLRERTLTAGMFFLGALVILQNNFVNGQVNLFVLALCLFCFRSLSDKKPALAGLSLAAAIAFKLTPLVLVGYLFLRREWKALFFTLAGILLFAFGLPALFAGPAILDYYQGYLTSYVLPSFSAITTDLAETFQFKNYLHALAPGLTGPVLSGFADLLILAPLAWVQWRGGKESGERREMALFSAYLAVSLWLSPISETHHLAALFPGLLLWTGHALWDGGRPLWKNAIPLGLVFVLLWVGLHQFVLYFAAIGLCYVFLLVFTGAGTVRGRRKSG